MSLPTTTRPSLFGKLQQLVLEVLAHPYFVAYCLGLAILLRAALVFLVPLPAPTSDAAWYFNQAIALSEGRGYMRSGEPTAYWPVGYPGFVAGLFYLFGPSMMLVALANLIMSGLSFLLLLQVARIVVTDEAVARLAVLLWTIYPNSIGYVGLALSETLFTALLLLGTWLFLRDRRYLTAVACGIVFGLATLTKSQALLFPAVLTAFAFLFVKADRFSIAALVRGAIVTIGMLIAIAPWTYRNYQVFGHAVLVSTNGGVSLLAGNNPSVKPDFRNDFSQTDPLFLQSGHPHDPEVAVDSKAKELALDWIKSNPGHFVSLIPHKLWRLWAPNGEAEWGYQDMGSFYDRNVSLFRALRWLNQGYYFTIILAVCAFPWMIRRGRGHEASEWLWLGIVFAGYLSAISVVFSGQSRYHFPVMPFLMINAAFVLLNLGRLKASSRRILDNRAVPV